MIPRRTRLALLFRRWYWDQPYHIRWLLNRAPDWLTAIAIGLIIGISAGTGF